MKDKCVLVTGSSSGIGYEITLKLLDLGAKVIGIARNHDRSKLENKNYTTYKCDVSAHKKLEILMKQILKKHPQINCFISNAGLVILVLLKIFQHYKSIISLLQI